MSGDVCSKCGINPDSMTPGCTADGCPIWGRPDHSVDVIIDAAKELIRAAAALGYDLSIEQHPMTPPAMGHHEHMVTVWPKRHPGEPVITINEGVPR